MSTVFVPEVIAATNSAFVNAFARGDAATCARCYTADGQALPPGSEPVVGHASIEAFWRGVMEMGVRAVKLATVEVELHEDMAYELGAYTLLSSDGAEIDRGKYIVVWRNDGPSWGWHRDIWNSNNA